jgi:3-oxoacyl-[acyl-carrier protein] reductase
MMKSVLITGASRGIGRAAAIAFAKAGYRLVITCSRSAAALLDLKNILERDYGAAVYTSVGDISDYSYVEELFLHIKELFGGVDVVVNNAGISHIGLLQDMTIEQWNRIVSTNLTSVFSTCRLAIPYMLQNQPEGGKIINISSVWGNVGASCEVAYSATKGGINAFTKALAKELAPSNIQVNAIACGVIDTQMNQCFSAQERAALAEEIPAGRFGTPEEVAALILQLSTGNEYLTGQIISLDGGWI